MFCFGSVQSHLTLVEVRNQRAISLRRATVGDRFDLIIESPPFLDDHQARCIIVAGRIGKITFALGAVGSLERNHSSHEICLLDSEFFVLSKPKRSMKSMRRAL